MQYQQAEWTEMLEETDTPSFQMLPGFRSLLQGCNIEMSDRGGLWLLDVPVDFDSFFEMNQEGGFVHYSSLRRHIQSNSVRCQGLG